MNLLTLAAVALRIQARMAAMPILATVTKPSRLSLHLPMYSAVVQNTALQKSFMEEPDSRISQIPIREMSLQVPTSTDTSIAAGWDTAPLHGILISLINWRNFRRYIERIILHRILPPCQIIFQVLF